MRHVIFTELRQTMANTFDRVTEDREPVVVTRQAGKGNVVILSKAEFDGWRETVHLLNSPHNAERLKESIRQVRGGGARERTLLDPDPTPA